MNPPGNILTNLRRELKKHSDPAYSRGSVNFFKEPIKLYGVRANLLKKITDRYWGEIKNLTKTQKLKIIEQLFQSNYNEEFSIGADWLYRLKNQLVKNDFPLLERWLKNHITNWAMCDDYCTHPLGFLIYRYPELIQQTKIWAKAKNRWLKRAAAVVHIHPTKQGSPFKKDILPNKNGYLKTVFQIANLLRGDADDLVQKGYGWMLKEAANLFPKEIFGYVLKNKAKMSRTALRYAIEKLPISWKNKAMK
ncbi:MAG: DNA alkylation repair protein [Candidatus Komeilibacteria bacterium]|nr:DNA alkylation repair protein [Candidatus Komeilibacteria bacterium]